MFHDYLVEYRDRPRDVRRAVLDLFEVFDTPIEERDPYMDDELLAFPYVNGNLFANARALEVPNFTPEIVSLLLNEASEGFDWSKISPTIFGAVFESTLNPETRRKGGMHYTSVENIHRVIDPLFLNDLKDELAKIRSIKTENTKTERLNAFHEKLASLTFFDPACGSGNFLTETYLSLRRLENEIIRIQSNGQVSFNIEGLSPIKISLAQFYGIEINDFACAVAKTALWIGESQMLNETEDILQKTLPFFPLKTLTNIVEGNALTMDWNDVVSQEKLNYIMGNPPFIGSSLMSKEQKDEITSLFSGVDLAASVDYVAGWYWKASEMMKETNIKTAFVSTNSITQGEQVAPIWTPLIKRFGIHIEFAHRTFRWDSEANNKAHVYCVIIGLSTNKSKQRTLYKYKSLSGDPEEETLPRLSPYLLDLPDILVSSVGSPMDTTLRLTKGNQPTDGGNFILSEGEKDEILKKTPELSPYIRWYLGGEDYLHSDIQRRYCLWLKDAPLDLIAKNKRLFVHICG